MIYRESTSALMEKFNSSIDKISEIQDDIKASRAAIDKRLSILNAQYEYFLQNMEALQDLSSEGAVKDKIVFAATDIDGGLYDVYGTTVHPKFSKTPGNLFNYKASTGYLFKGNVTVSVSEDEDEDPVEDPDYLEMLKYDSIKTKDYIIKEYNEDVIYIVIDRDDSKASLGSTNFNMIEMLPFLPGSFDIDEINIYERNMDVPSHRLTYLKSVGPCRLILDEKVPFSRVEFRIKLHFKNSNNKYVFGLRHLYFLNANFEDDSYIIVHLTKANNLNYLYDDVVIKNQFGTYLDYVLDDFDIECFASYENDVLSRKIEPSTKDKKRYISANIRTIYFRVPISTSFISMIPSIETN